MSKKKPSLEDQLARVVELGRGPMDEPARQELTKTLQTATSVVAARAARVVRERSLPGYLKTLDAAFRRFLDNPVKSDPGCNAKLACIEALDACDATDPDPFLLAARHVQKEGSFGPPVDTAAPLRARAIKALAHMGFADILLVGGELLGDAEAGVRQAAAESLAHAGDRNGAGLLLLAAARPDEEPVVQTSYFAGLLALAPDYGLPRLKAALRSGDPERVELAAIALGQSGLEPAIEALIEAMEATPLASERAAFVHALGLHRSDRALKLLCDIVSDGPQADAEAAVKSLATRRFDRGVRERVEALVLENGSRRLLGIFEDAFSAEV